MLAHQSILTCENLKEKKERGIMMKDALYVERIWNLLTNYCLIVIVLELLESMLFLAWEFLGLCSFQEPSLGVRRVFSYKS